MEYFNNSIHTPEGVGLYTLLQVLRVLLASVSKLKEENRTSLQKDLLALVKRFMIPPELISTAIGKSTGRDTYFSFYALKIDGSD